MHLTLYNIILENLHVISLKLLFVSTYINDKKMTNLLSKEKREAMENASSGLTLSTKRYIFSSRVFSKYFQEL